MVNWDLAKKSSLEALQILDWEIVTKTDDENFSHGEKRKQGKDGTAAGCI